VTAPSKDPIGELLAQSLIAWGVAASIERMNGGGFRIHADTRQISVERAASDLPFRWMVGLDGRRRGAVSIVSVLRQLRAALDPEYAAKRVRVAVAPPVSS
jgi:hypothetical protein